MLDFAWPRKNRQPTAIGNCRINLGRSSSRFMGLKGLTFLVAAILAFGGMSIRAQDAGALLDLLVRKKLITDQEAEEVRAELTKESATTSGGKWKLSSPITEIELYGDVRLRYQYNGGQTDDNSPLARPANGVAG